MANLVSRSEFARIAGVSPAAVSKWAKGPGSKSCAGTRIDRDHPDAKAYLAAKGVGAKAPALAPGGSPTNPTGARRRARESVPEVRPAGDGAPPTYRKPEVIDLENDFDSFAEMTLRAFIDTYGSAQGAKDVLDAFKKRVDIQAVELKNAETEGRLIERELVHVHIFGALETLNRRLLAEAPKTIARKIYALANSGAALEDAEKTVRDLIGSHLRPVKDTAARALRSRHDGGDQRS